MVDILLQWPAIAGKVPVYDYHDDDASQDSTCITNMFRVTFAQCGSVGLIPLRGDEIYSPP